VLAANLSSPSLFWALTAPHWQSVRQEKSSETLTDQCPAVTENTTVNEIHEHLHHLGFVPSTGRDCFYFTLLPENSPYPRRATARFSTDSPNCEPNTVWSTVIPPLSLVRDLETAFSQAWLNGAQSLVDPNNNSLRLPLWTLQFYREIISLCETQKTVEGKCRLASDRGALPPGSCWMEFFACWGTRRPVELDKTH
jgi:hypothetical protein